MIERITFTLALLLTTLITLILFIICWKQKSAGPPALYLAICTLTVAIYSFGYAMEIRSETLETAMFWVRFQHWGIEFIAPAWLLFSLAVSGYEKRISKGLFILLFIVPAVLLFMAQTLGGLNLGHINPRMDTSGSFPIFTYDHGLYNLCAIGFYSICLAASFIIFVIMYFRSAPSFRKQAVIYLAGSVLPWVAMILYNLNLTSSKLDYTPLALGISEIIFTFGFFKFGILDILPLARDTIFENMEDGVLILDKSNRIIDFNPALIVVLPELKRDDIGRPFCELLSEESSLMNWIKLDTTDQVEIKINYDGSTFYYRVKSSPVLNKKGKYAGKIISFYEFTSEKQLLQKLERLAATDGLTGIFNRQHLDNLLCKEISRIQRYGGMLSLIMLDLDQFKSINDTYGHIAGDKTLTTVVDTLNSVLRESDILARFGGDEFLILAPHTHVSDAKALAERLCLALEKKRIHYEGHTFNIKASFGITSVHSGFDSTPETLYRLADLATYQAKARGGNTVCVSLNTGLE